MYFKAHGGRIYRDPVLEAMRLSVVFDGAPTEGITWPSPDYWPVPLALDLWRFFPAIPT